MAKTSFSQTTSKSERDMHTEIEQNSKNGRKDTTSFIAAELDAFNV